MTCCFVSAFPDIKNTTPRIEVEVDEMVELQCFAEGYPLQDIEWEFTDVFGSLQFTLEYVVNDADNATICTSGVNRTGNMNFTYINESAGVSQSNIEMKYIIYQPDTDLQKYGTLAITNISVFEAGEYKCTLSNIHSRASTDEFSYTAAVGVQCEFD